MNHSWPRDVFSPHWLTYLMDLRNSFWVPLNFDFRSFFSDNFLNYFSFFTTLSQFSFRPCPSNFVRHNFSTQLYSPPIFVFFKFRCVRMCYHKFRVNVCFHADVYHFKLICVCYWLVFRFYVSYFFFHAVSYIF